MIKKTVVTESDGHFPGTFRLSRPSAFSLWSGCQAAEWPLVCVGADVPERLVHQHGPPGTGNEDRRLGPPL